MISLLENAVLRGTSENEFRQEIQEIDSSTYYTRKVTPEEIHLAFLEPCNNGQAFYVFPREYPFHALERKYPLTEENEFVFENDKLKEELERHGWVAFVDGEWKHFVFGERALQDILTFAGILGRASGYHTPELVEAALVQLYNNRDQVTDAKGKPYHPTFRMMYRLDAHGNQKIFSVRSGKYSKIPQQEIINLIDEMRNTTRFGCGDPVLESYEITNFMTTVNINFPEIAEDYARVFQLEEPVMPGIEIVTSDSGDSAFQVIPILNVGNTTSLPIPVVTDRKTKVAKRHVGQIITERILERANLEIFGEYKQWPERVAKIAVIRTRVNVYDALKEIFSAMDLHQKNSVISVEKEEQIIQKLCEFYGKIEDTPYNIVKHALRTCELDILSENQKEYLKRYLLLAFYADFEDLVARQKGVYLNAV